MTALRVLLAATVLLGLSACDSSGSSTSATSGVWAGTAEFQIDTLMAGQNFRVLTDYETRYEFELTEDEDGLVLGYLYQYNTGTFTLREPRDDEEGNQTIIERTAIWDDDLVQTWPVYGTYGRPTLELDLPQAEELGIFPKDLWTFTVVGDRARLEATQIIHGYTFEVFEDYESDFTITLSPSNQDEFSLRRQ